MLTSTIEYKELKNRIALFLHINPRSIYSIKNPTRKQVKGIWLISIENNKGIMLREINGILKYI